MCTLQGVQLFEQGYGKDPASIAQAAIQLAKERKFDVVLVDTAGRMQDNEPLMRALSKVSLLSPKYSNNNNNLADHCEQP